LDKKFNFSKKTIFHDFCFSSKIVKTYSNIKKEVIFVFSVHELTILAHQDFSRLKMTIISLKLCSKYVKFIFNACFSFFFRRNQSTKNLKTAYSLSVCLGLSNGAYISSNDKKNYILFQLCSKYVKLRVLFDVKIAKNYFSQFFKSNDKFKNKKKTYK
jgi:hypothetical protein